MAYFPFELGYPPIEVVRHQASFRLGILATYFITLLIGAVPVYGRFKSTDLGDSVAQKAGAAIQQINRVVTPQVQTISIASPTNYLRIVGIVDTTQSVKLNWFVVTDDRKLKCELAYLGTYFHPCVKRELNWTIFDAGRTVSDWQVIVKWFAGFPFRHNLHSKDWNDIIGSGITDILGTSLHISGVQPGGDVASKRLKKLRWADIDYARPLVLNPMTFGKDCLDDESAGINNTKECGNGCRNHQNFVVESGGFPSLSNGLWLAALGLLGTAFCVFSLVLRIVLAHRGVIASSVGILAFGAMFTIGFYIFLTAR